MNFFRLLLPILIPSWRFFRCVDPSPRIYYQLLENRQVANDVLWLEFRPRPLKRNITQVLSSLFYHPDWNEKLYMNTCAEHLYEGEQNFWSNEIQQRLLKAIKKKEIKKASSETCVRFKIVALIKQEGQVKLIPIYHSPIIELSLHDNAQPTLSYDTL